jgi:hypothetical protein
MPRPPIAAMAIQRSKEFPAVIRRPAQTVQSGAAIVLRSATKTFHS